MKKIRVNKKLSKAWCAKAAAIMQSKAREDEINSQLKLKSEKYKDSDVKPKSGMAFSENGLYEYRLCYDGTREQINFFNYDEPTKLREKQLAMQRQNQANEKSNKEKNQWIFAAIIIFIFVACIIIANYIKNSQ